jgi:S-adenosylmethionine:tRNA ribosyltransferase-isomerase
MVLSRSTGSIEHTHFDSFPSLPNPGDVVVVNVSRVIKARLTGLRENGREAEVLLTKPAHDGTWLAMVHPGGKLKKGRTVRFGEDAVGEVVDVLGGGLRRIQFSGSLTVEQLMDRYGATPLPPYIDRPADEADEIRYQTVYAQENGSVAAPTAGLHFTPEVLDDLRAKDVAIAKIVLHVGPGTFKPVEVENPVAHPMHEEWFSISEDAAQTILRTKTAGNRVWAVGTTSARVLETLANRDELKATSGWTDLFVYPPYQFKLVDALLTNFHLPRSTLIMLVSAFAGYEQTMNAYRVAVAAGYRLYSYGDAMVVL